MANFGEAPPDFSTAVGQFRLIANDTTYTAVTGGGDYLLFSDDEIDAFLAAQPGSVYRAVGLAYMGLANRAALESESIKDYDLAVDSRNKAGELRAQANWYFAEADRFEAGDEGFTIVSTGRQYGCAELAECERYGRCGCYTWGF